MNNTKISSLLSSKRFLPLFLTQFFGAFNDNIFKNALIVLFSYSLVDQLPWDTSSTVAMCAGLFILPYFLFSSTGGQLADRLHKHTYIQYTKISEFAIMAFASVALISNAPIILLATLFLMGAQSAFFGPVKYAILPVHLKKSELLLGNALIEGSTYVAILVGTIAGTSLILKPFGPYIISALTLIVATSGYLASRKIPTAPKASPNLKINPNILAETYNVIRYATKDKKLFTAIIGISWFWYLGATLLTIIPPYVSEFLKAPESYIALLMSIIAIGIGSGAILCAKLLHGELSGRFVPIAGLTMSLTLYLFIKANSPVPENLNSLVDFFTTSSGLLIAFSLFTTAALGGFYSVPLYTLLQAWSDPEHRARNIGANNVMNALFMTIAAIAAIIIYATGGNVFSVLKSLALLNIFFAIYTVYIIPEAVSHTIFKYAVKFLYNLQINGKENLKLIKPEDKLVIIANHSSLIDPAIITPILPFRTYYAIDPNMRQKWWVKCFLWICETFPVDPTSPFAIKQLTKLANQGKKVVIFPEGRITTTGALMKLYDGPALVAQKANAKILPIHISGAHKTPFSYLQGKTRRSLFPQITVTIGKPQFLETDPNLHGKDARHARTDALYKIMSTNVTQSRSPNFTLFQALLNAAYTHKSSSPSLLNPSGSDVSYTRLIASSLTLAILITKNIPKDQPIGILLPNSNTTVTTFLALQAKHRTPALLNPAASPQHILHACHTTQTKHIWTSQQFIDKANLHTTIQYLKEHSINIHYLESLKKKKKVLFPYYLLARHFSQYLYSFNIRKLKPLEIHSDPAALLFTSGSESHPKAVALSHSNMLANIAQMTSVVDFVQSDRALNPLPLFHAFGLTAGTLTPLLSGVPVLLYPNPLHYGIIPELIYRENISIFFATNTLLQGYAKRAEPFDFFNIRYIFAGAEPITNAVRTHYALHYGTRILEGYGTTEASPVLALNTPLYHKPGSVGKFLPNVQHKLLPIDGISSGHKLLVKGPNIMLGYISEKNPGQIIPPKNGWYDTGDIVTIDPQGYLHIVGREKRFVKIGGERISLTLPESLASQLYPEHLHAAIATPHPTKGEQITLFTNHPNPSIQELQKLAKHINFPSLALPSSFTHKLNIPTLPTGKPNYLLLLKSL